MSLKQKIEENLTITVLGLLFAGFMTCAGIFKAAIEILGLELIPKSEVARLKNRSPADHIPTVRKIPEDKKSPDYQESERNLEMGFSRLDGSSRLRTNDVKGKKIGADGQSNKSDKEDLVYYYDDVNTFQNESKNKRYSILTFYASNLGYESAKNVRIVAKFFFSGGKVVDYGVSLSSGPAGSYTARLASPDVLEIQIPVLTCDEKILVNVIIDGAAMNPDISIKSDNSTGIFRKFEKPKPYQSRHLF